MCVLQEGSTYLQRALMSRCGEAVVTESMVHGILNITAFVAASSICLAMYRNARLRSGVHMYILSYAAIDLLMSVLVMPFTLGVLIKGKWISSTSVCQFQGYTVSVLGILTSLTMMLTALDRYVATTRLPQYVIFFKRRYICGALAVCWLVSFTVPLSYTIHGDDFVFHPGYAVCKAEASEANYLQASLLKIILINIPFIVIAVCYCRARASVADSRKKERPPSQGASEGRMVNLNAWRWREEESNTRLFAALVLGTLVFWIPTYICDVVDAFTHAHCLPRSVYLLATLLINVASCLKPLIIASMDPDFNVELRRTFKLRKTRKVVDILVERSSKNAKFIAAESRRYVCEIDDGDMVRVDESSV